MLRPAIFILSLFALGSGVARADDDASEAAKSLQGEWQAIALKANGIEATEEGVKAFRMTVKGHEIALMTCKGDRCVERTQKFKLDPTKSPMQIDLLSLDGHEKGMTARCIFSLQEGRLRLCVPLSADGPAERPAEFETRAGDG